MSRLHNKQSFSVRKHAITTAGTPEHLGGWMKASTISFTHNAGSADTINDSGSAFITKGFKSGDSITVSGASNSGNNDTFTISSITAGAITLESGVVLTTEVAGSAVTITAAARHPQDVDDGIKVVVRADPGNTGNVYIGNSSANATSTSNNNMPLSPNSTCSMQVSHLNSIWVDTATSGNSVIYQFES